MRKWIERFNAFLAAREPREKQLIALFMVAVILAVDYLVFIRPVMGSLARTTPELGRLKMEYKALREDEKNREEIEKNWRIAGEKLQGIENGFVSGDEVPGMLEELSKLASDNGVRLLSLEPKAVTLPEGKKNRLYASVPIKITALAGTHELGRFLAQLETSPTAFKVTNLKITANPLEPYRHQIDLDFQAFQKI